MRLVLTHKHDSMSKSPNSGAETKHVCDQARSAPLRASKGPLDACMAGEMRFNVQLA